jgi:hypothetical protein
VSLGECTMRLSSPDFARTEPLFFHSKADVAGAKVLFAPWLPSSPTWR